MKNNIFKIIVFIIVIISIPVGFYIFIKNIPYLLHTFYKESYINIQEDGEMIIEDNIEMNIKRNFLVRVPLTISGEDKIKQIDIYVNGTKVELYSQSKVMYDDSLVKINVGSYNCFYLSKNAIKEKAPKIKVIYKYDVSDIITNYRDVSILKISLTDKEYYKKYMVNINLPSNVRLFNLDLPKANISKLSEKEYKVDLTKVESNYGEDYAELQIEKGVLKGANEVNEVYKNKIKEKYQFDQSLEKKERWEKRKKYVFCMGIIAIGEIILFIIITILSRRKKFDNIYNREPQNVIEPILAESLIDGKINAKNLIMSCIVDLVNRGNIKNINNEEFELVNTDNLSDYEMDIVDLIFDKYSLSYNDLFYGLDDIDTLREIKQIDQKMMYEILKERNSPSQNNIIKFEEINQIFKNNRKTKKFLKRFLLIKEKIEREFFEKELFSKKGEIFLNCVRTFSILIYIMCIFVYSFISSSEDMKMAIFTTIFVSPIVLIVYETIFKKNIIQLGDKETEIIVYGLFTLGICSISLFIDKYAIIDICGVLLLLITNTMLLIRTKIHIYTKKGEEEYQKALGLKKYIEDYSLMKDRDVDSTIIWDKYLSYAVAFGIPNKITDKFNETLMETSRVLQQINKILKF